MRLPPPTMQLGRSQGGDHTAAEVVNPCRWSASRSYRSPMVYPSSTPAIPNCHPSVPRTKLRSIHLQCQPTIVDPHPKPTPGDCTSPLQNPSAAIPKSNPWHSLHPLFALTQRCEGYKRRNDPISKLRALALDSTYLLSCELRRVRHDVRSSRWFVLPLCESLHTPQHTTLLVSLLLRRGSQQASESG